MPTQARIPVLAILLAVSFIALAMTAAPSLAQVPSVRFAFEPQDGRVGCDQKLSVFLEIDASITDLRGFTLILDFDDVYFKPRSVRPGPLITEAECSHQIHWLNRGEDADSIVVELAMLGCAISGPGEILKLEFEDAGTRGMSSLDLRSGEFRDMNNRSIPYIKTTALMVNDCNHPAVAEDDVFTLAQGGTLSETGQGLLANDSDPDGDFIRIDSTPTRSPRHGTLTIFDLGAFEYVHDGGESTTDRFDYELSDSYDGKDTATVYLTITPQNDPPAALVDVYTVVEGGALSEAAPGVLANDSDPENDPLTVKLPPLQPPRHGVVTLQSTGAFEYRHDGSETTTDRFVYEVEDGQGNMSATTVQLSIAARNDEPLAGDDSFVLDAGGSLNAPAPGILANDRDPEGETLILTLTPLQAPQHGALTLHATGAFEYVHDGSGTDSDTFVYELRDAGGAVVTATVNLRIAGRNQSPIAVDDAYVLVEGGTLSVHDAGLLHNDSDPEGRRLKVDESPLAGPNHGRLTLFSDGTFDYIHDGGETMVDTFVYRLSDMEGATAEATVTLSIALENEPPRAGDDRFDLMEGGLLSEGAPGLLANDRDPDGNALQVNPAPRSLPRHGRLTLAPDGAFQYRHDGDENFVDSFVYELGDGKGGSTTATVTLNISPVNDRPSARNDTYILPEGDSLIEPAPGILANDLDPDGDSLNVVTKALREPSHGTLVLSADGAFTYIHDGSESPADSFVYELQDGKGGGDTGVVAIAIGLLNEDPRAVNDLYTLIEGETLVVSGASMLMNDSDPDGDALHVAASPLSGPEHGLLNLRADGSFDYTHDGSESATDRFVYELRDGRGGRSTATVILRISLENENPMARGDVFTVAEGDRISLPGPGLLDNDHDTDNDPMTVNSAPLIGPRHGRLTLFADGAFEYLHDGSESVADSFVYELLDGMGGRSTATVALNITPRDDPASVVYPGDQSSLEREAISLQILALDAENDLPRFDASGLPPGLNVDRTNGLVTGLIECGAASGSPFLVQVSIEDRQGRRDETNFKWFIEPLSTLGAIRDLEASVREVGKNIAGMSPIDLDWTGVPDGYQLEVYRKGFGAYPEFDDAGGSEPVPPATPEEALAGGWTLIDCSVKPCRFDDPLTRDCWYYVAFVQSPCGGARAVSNLSEGVLNYRPGDIVPGDGDNIVEYQDVSTLGSCYGKKDGEEGYLGACDVGPTVDNSFTGRSLTDDVIDFEDMMVFALNYNVPERRPTPPLPAQMDVLTLFVPEQLPSSGEFEVLFWISGRGGIRGMSIPLKWDEDTVEPLDFVGGDFLAAHGGMAPTLSPRPGEVDLALFGQRDSGLSGTGLLGTMKFRVLSGGDPRLRFGTVKARNAGNDPVRLTTELSSGMPELRGIPIKSVLYGNTPEPFDPSTRIDFGLAVDGPVIIKLYDVDGRLVRTLLKEAFRAGRHSVTWDGKDHSGTSVVAGAYLVQMQAPDHSQTRRITLRR